MLGILAFLCINRRAMLPAVTVAFVHSGLRAVDEVADESSLSYSR